MKKNILLASIVMSALALSTTNTKSQTPGLIQKPSSTNVGTVNTDWLGTNIFIRQSAMDNDGNISKGFTQSSASGSTVKVLNYNPSGGLKNPIVTLTTPLYDADPSNTYSDLEFSGIVHSEDGYFVTGTGVRRKSGTIIDNADVLVWKLNASGLQVGTGKSYPINGLQKITDITYEPVSKDIVIAYTNSTSNSNNASAIKINHTTLAASATYNATDGTSSFSLTTLNGKVYMSTAYGDTYSVIALNTSLIKDWEWNFEDESIRLSYPTGLLADVTGIYVSCLINLPTAVRTDVSQLKLNPGSTTGVANWTKTMNPIGLPGVTSIYEGPSKVIMDGFRNPVICSSISYTTAVSQSTPQSLTFDGFCAFILNRNTGERMTDGFKILTSAGTSLTSSRNYGLADAKVIASSNNIIMSGLFDNNANGKPRLTTAVFGTGPAPLFTARYDLPSTPTYENGLTMHIRSIKLCEDLTKGSVFNHSVNNTTSETAITITGGNFTLAYSYIVPCTPIIADPGTGIHLPGTISSVYPNPAKEVLNVDLLQKEDGKSIVKIIDVAGYERFSGVFDNAISINLQHLDLVPGKYFLVVEKNGKTESRHIIIE